MILFVLLMYLFEEYISPHIKIISLLLIILSIVVNIIYYIKTRKINYKLLVYSIIFIGLVVRVTYMFNTTIYERQHDVETLDSNGHLEYIYSLYKTNKLPSDNSWQHYQPPLFHLMGAGWLKFAEILQLPLAKALEGIQILPVIFSSLIMFVMYGITNKLKINNKYKLLINLFVAIHPTFIILSGSINNDCLLTLLQISIVYYLIKWYEKNNIVNTILLALCTGLCVMTKFNGAIMAVPILYVFVKKFIEEIKSNKKGIPKFISKIILFGLISLPIGLWYEIRQLILFGSNSVPEPADFLYIGDYSIIDRFIKIDIGSLFNIFCKIPGDYNLFSYIVKCSIFGEYVFDNNMIITCLLLMFNFILIILSIYFIIKYIISKKSHNLICNILLILYIVNLGSFYVFNMKYPYICTMDFRYIVPTLFTSIVLMNYDSLKCNKYLRIITNSLLLGFCILSLGLFI